MKLRKLNQENVSGRSVQQGIPAVTFSKSGSVFFSRAIEKRLLLKEGTRVNLHQDMEHPSDWYIEITDDNDGFELKRYSDHLAFNRITIVRNVWKSTGTQGTVRFPVKTKPFMYKGTAIYQVITGKNPVEEL